MNRHTYACIKHREVRRNPGKCPVCSDPLRHMGYRWRAPKKRDDQAWRRVEQGEVMWDRRASAAARGQAEGFADYMRRLNPRRATWMRP